MCEAISHFKKDVPGKGPGTAETLRHAAFAVYSMGAGRILGTGAFSFKEAFEWLNPLKKRRNK
jgi:hypothetical protein